MHLKSNFGLNSQIKKWNMRCFILALLMLQVVFLSSMNPKDDLTIIVYDFYKDYKCNGQLIITNLDSAHFFENAYSHFSYIDTAEFKYLYINDSIHVYFNVNNFIGSSSNDLLKLLLSYYGLSDEIRFKMSKRKEKNEFLWNLIFGKNNIRGSIYLYKRYISYSYYYTSYSGYEIFVARKGIIKGKTIRRKFLLKRLKFGGKVIEKCK